MNSAMQQFRKNMLVLLVSFVIIGILAFVVVRDTTGFFVEKQAEDVAKIVAVFATTARSVYSEEVISKLKKDGLGAKVDYPAHKGYVPIPAQFLKYLGKASSDNTTELFSYHPVSKWNIEPTQGLSTDFLIWAWPQLEAQDLASPNGPIDWQPVIRIDTVGGNKVMRFLTADPAVSESCVSCHNAHEKMPSIISMRQKAGVEVGKEWQQHQLLGALEVTIPLGRIEEMASAQLNRATLWVLIILAGSLLFIIGGYFVNSRLHKRMAKLSWQANHDALTRLYNRHAFECEGKRLWKTAKNRHQEHVLVVLDLDKFKPINDNFGHQAGDEVLKKVANVLRENRRSQDVIARMGGDEFAIILPDCKKDYAFEIAVQIQQNIETIQVQWKGDVITIGVSIGMCMINDKAEDLEQVIDLADAASYIAKMSHEEKVIINEL